MSQDTEDGVERRASNEGAGQLQDQPQTTTVEAILPSPPAISTVVSVVLGLSLLGGISLVYAGVGLWTTRYVPEAGIVVLGLYLVTLSYVLAQVAARAEVT
jgi:hypothetical protein